MVASPCSLHILGTEGLGHASHARVMHDTPRFQLRDLYRTKSAGAKVQILEDRKALEKLKALL